SMAGPTCVRPTPEQLETRGFAWIAGAFVLCPCHLPLTLWLLAALLSGMSAGALLLRHSLLVGSLITLVWGLATWRGIQLLRAARRQAAPFTDSRGGTS